MVKADDIPIPSHALLQILDSKRRFEAIGKEGRVA